jgi:hypothetical protein
MIISPCVSICKTDPVTSYCYGCARTNEEKKIWEDEKTTEEWKKNNLEEITKRMSGWQLNSFKESYEHKIKSGVSLFQKHSIQEKP